MEVEQQDPQEKYTILRIKRKRNEEPLDALVVDSQSRRKKTRGGLNVFQFAETVEAGAWDDEKQKKALESRLSELAKSKKEAHTSLAALSPSVPKDTIQSSTSRAQVEEPSRKYTILPTESKEPVPSSKTLRAPPKVHSYKDLEKASFMMYEAVPSLAAAAASSPVELDEDMERFLPMLQDYLKINEAQAATPASTSHEDDDYVYDVFYQRPTTFQELYEHNTNIASVTGLPPESDGYDSESDSDYVDEDDEDSNAEDWYKNDYPDEESNDSWGDGGSDGSDLYHEHSDNDEQVHERPDPFTSWR